MKTATRLTTTDRDRSVRRLRTITIGTALAGVIGVGGFGGVAAATNRGTSPVTATVEASTSGVAAIDTGTPTSAGTPSATSSAAATASAAPTATARATATPAQVSTGGS